MFTGLIEEIGVVSGIVPMRDGKRIEVTAEKVLSDLKVDDSVAINGVCQTAVRVSGNKFTVEAVGETLRKTTLGSLQSGSKVNLERAVTLNTRMGGHLVQGHVSGTAKISQWIARAENWYLEIQLPAALEKYCIAEGSIAIDGVSLTIANINGMSIGLNIIPHTVKSTTLQFKKAGDLVNIEVDLIAKYLEKLMLTKNESTLTIDKLKNMGY